MYPGNLTKNQIVLFLNAVGTPFLRVIFSHSRFRKTAVLSLILTSLLLPRAAGAQFLLSTNNGAITIMRYTGNALMVVVPAATNGLPVTSIGNSAFQYNNVNMVTVPGSVTNLADTAFYMCGNLTNVALSEGLLNIGPNAFYGCPKLAYVTIPGSVTNIGNGAFSSAAFTNIFVPANVSYIGVNAFGGPTLTNISVDPGNANS
jgi:hypothetical protein